MPIIDFQKFRKMTSLTNYVVHFIAISVFIGGVLGDLYLFDQTNEEKERVCSHYSATLTSPNKPPQTYEDIGKANLLNLTGVLHYYKRMVKKLVSELNDGKDEENLRFKLELELTPYETQKLRDFAKTESDDQMLLLLQDTTDILTRMFSNIQSSHFEPRLQVMLKMLSHMDPIYYWLLFASVRDNFQNREKC